MINALQTTIYTTLTAALVGSSDVVAVYDQVPQSADGALNTPFPYVVLGDFKPNQNDTDDEVGFDGTMLVHVWSRYNGNKEASVIQGLIYAALHRTQPTVTGYGVSDVQQVFGEILRDPDGLTRHGVQRFRVIITPV